MVHAGRSIGKRGAAVCDDNAGWGCEVTANLVELKTGKPAIEVSQALVEAIKDACYEHGEGFSVALIIGALEIAKWDLLTDHSE